MVTTRRRAYEPRDYKPKRRKTDYQRQAQSVSRACRICAVDAPRYLSVMNPCGHAVCRACSLKLRWDAFENGTPCFALPVLCSTCRSEGTFVQLNEDFVANIPDETEDSSDADDERALAEAARIRAAASAALDAASAASDAMQPVKEAFIRAQHALVEALRTELALERDGTCDEAHRTHRKDLEERAKLADMEMNRAIEAAQTSTDRMVEIKESFEKSVAHVLQLIDRCKQENEGCATRGLRFSRACRACSTESPLLRSFFPACGHAVCRECADKATAREADTSCPICHKEGSAIPLFEEMTEC